MAQVVHLTCAFPDRAIGIADKLGDMARQYGLVAWTTARAGGDWQIRIEGEEERLRTFAVEIGFSNFDTAADVE